MDDAVHVPGYTLGRRLGGGEFGAVFSAHENTSGHPVAIKILPIRDPQARAQAAREALLLANLRHPHLVPMLGAVEIPEGLALVMEFAGGGSLADLISTRGPLRAGEVVTVCAPVAQGLAEAHGHGVVHGTIKPSNILFTVDGRPMLADAGVARLLPQRHPAAGGDGYAAPEVAAGRRPTPASDMFGMAGATVFALTGRPPGPELSLQGLPPATYAVLAGGLSNDPGSRSDADSFAKAVFALADPEPVSLTGEEVVHPAGPVHTGDDLPVLDLDDGEDGENARAAGGRRARRSHRKGGPSGSSAAAPEPAAAESAGSRGGGSGGDASGGDGRRLRKRDILSGLAIVLILPIVAFGVYVLWHQIKGDELPLAGRADDPAEVADESSELCGGQYPAPAQQPPSPGDWTGVIENLYSLRAQAYVELDSELLCEIYAPSHPRLASDYEALKAYVEEGVHVEGLQFEVRTANLVSQESGLVTIEITDRVSPYQLIDEQGNVVHEEPGSQDQTWQIELVPSEDGASWRIG